MITPEPYFKCEAMAPQATAQQTNESCQKLNWCLHTTVPFTRLHVHLSKNYESLLFWAAHKAHASRPNSKHYEPLDLNGQ